MSKISQARMSLEEQAFDLGFESLEDATEHGYEYTLIPEPKLTLSTETVNSAYQDLALERNIKRNNIVSDLERLAMAQNIPEEYRNSIKNIVDRLREIFREEKM